MSPPRSDCSEEFVDAQGDRIAISWDHLSVYASHGGKQIGHIEVDEPFDRPILFHMAVDPAFQRRGIGTAMMRRVAEIHGPRIGRPSFTEPGGSGKESYEYFTAEGAALVRRCISLGILEDIERSLVGEDE